MNGEADDCTDDYKSEDYVDDYKDDRGSQDRWKNGRPMTRNSRRSTHVCVCLQILLIRVAPNYQIPLNRDFQPDSINPFSSSLPPSNEFSLEVLLHTEVTMVSKLSTWYFLICFNVAKQKVKYYINQLSYHFIFISWRTIIASFFSGLGIESCILPLMTWTQGIKTWPLR